MLEPPTRVVAGLPGSLVGSPNCPTGNGDVRDLELSSRLELWIGGAVGERALWHEIHEFLGGREAR